MQSMQSPSARAGHVKALARFIADPFGRGQAHARGRHCARTVGCVDGLLAALAARDGYTGEHSHAVRDHAITTGRQLGLSGADLADVRTAALLHDIGKLGISDDVLGKRGPLDEDEWVEIRRHPAIGAQIVASLPGLAHLEPIIRAQHERWDGLGYPDGLRGTEIPLASRITFVCDTYQAMTSDRPYRDAVSHDEAVRELRAHTGTQFCPRSTAAFLEVLAAPATLAPPAAQPAQLQELRDRRHDRAADAHDDDGTRHDHAAWHWARRRDDEKADLAQRDAALDRELADVDRQSARLERRRAG